MFDPLEIIGLLIIQMKMLFHELCRKKLNWNTNLEGRAKQKWDDWIKGLSEIEKIVIGRCIYKVPKQEIVKSVLHGFGDASAKGYCAVIYLVYYTKQEVHPILLTSRSRVAPLKVLSIPRLELMSARILAQLVDTVKKALRNYIELDGSKCWLDSKTALCWVKNKGEWKQFVHHRVTEILRLTYKDDWRLLRSQ